MSNGLKRLLYSEVLAYTCTIFLGPPLPAEYLQKFCIVYAVLPKPLHVGQESGILPLISPTWVRHKLLLTNYPVSSSWTSEHPLLVHILMIRSKSLQLQVGLLAYLGYCLHANPTSEQFACFNNADLQEAHFLLLYDLHWWLPSWALICQSGPRHGQQFTSTQFCRRTANCVRVGILGRVSGEIHPSPHALVMPAVPD